MTFGSANKKKKCPNPTSYVTRLTSISTQEEGTITFPSSAAVLISICWQFHFDEAVKNDVIVLFGGIVTSKTSTDNWPQQNNS